MKKLVSLLLAIIMVLGMSGLAALAEGEETYVFLTALASLEAFDNRGAYLAIIENSTNLDTTMRVVETIVEGLKEASAQ